MMHLTPITVQDVTLALTEGRRTQTGRKLISFCDPQEQQYLVVNTQMPMSKIEFHPVVGLKVHYTIAEAEHLIEALKTAVQVAKEKS